MFKKTHSMLHLQPSPTNEPDTSDAVPLSSRITALVPDEKAAPECDATGVPFKVLTDKGHSDSPDRIPGRV